MSDRAYDSLLFLSFGGPERMDDVMPFLRSGWSRLDQTRGLVAGAPPVPDGLPGTIHPVDPVRNP